MVCTVEFGKKRTRSKICKDDNGILFIRFKGHKWKVIFKREEQFNYSRTYPQYHDIYTIIEPYEEG